MKKEMYKTENLHSKEFSCEELTFDELQTVNAGSAITWGAGWLLGATLGGLVRGASYVWGELQRDGTGYAPYMM